MADCCFDDAQQHAAQHGAGKIAHAAQHCGAKRFQAQQRAHGVVGDAVVVPTNHDAGDGRQRGAYHEGRGDHLVDVDAQQAGVARVLRRQGCASAI